MTEIKTELAERFVSCLDHYFGIEETDVDSAIASFDRLCDTVDEIPAPLIKHTNKLIEFVGHEKFEAALASALEDVGRTFAPNDAADFLTHVNASLPFLKVA